MQGGTISGNTASTGNGVSCLGNFKMSGSAYITADNDVWLTEKITITRELTTEGTVATITPSSYGTAVKVLDGESSLVSSASSKFAVTNDSQGGKWRVNTDGYLEAGPLGSKSQPSAVGDIVFSDGTAEAYSANMQLSDKQKNAAVAVIFKVSGADKYGVGLTQSNSTKWASADARIYYEQAFAQALASECSDDNGALNNYSITDDMSYYPSLQWVSNLGSGWYFPAKNELSALMSSSSMSTVNSSINKVGGTSLSGNYWSSTLVEDGMGAYAYVSGSINGNSSFTSTYNVRAIKKF